MINRPFLFACAVSLMTPFIFTTGYTNASETTADSTPSNYIEGTKMPIVDPLNPEIEVTPGGEEKPEVIPSDSTTETDYSTTDQIESSTRITENYSEETKSETLISEIKTTENKISEETVGRVSHTPEKEEILTSEVGLSPKVREDKNNKKKSDKVIRIVKKKPKRKTKVKKEVKKREVINKKNKLYLSDDLFNEKIVLNKKIPMGGNNKDDIDTNLGKLAQELSGMCIYGLLK